MTHAQALAHVRHQVYVARRVHEPTAGLFSLPPRPLAPLHGRLSATVPKLRTGRLAQGRYDSRSYLGRALRHRCTHMLCLFAVDDMVTGKSGILSGWGLPQHYKIGNYRPVGAFLGLFSAIFIGIHSVGARPDAPVARACKLQLARTALLYALSWSSAPAVRAALQAGVPVSKLFFLIGLGLDLGTLAYVIRVVATERAATSGRSPAAVPYTPL